MKTNFQFCIVLVLISLNLLSCNNQPSLKPQQLNWKLTTIDSIEVIYFPDYLDQKKYVNEIWVDTSFQQLLKLNIVADTIPLNDEAFQYKIYLFNRGEPYKTLYISTTNGKEFLSYVVNGKKFYHPLNKKIKLALQE